MIMEMSDEDLIIKINKILKEPWGVKETSEGKRIPMKWEWAKSINSIVKRYRSKGWTVTKHVATDGEERQLYLTFKNSLWLKRKKGKGRKR